MVSKILDRNGRPFKLKNLEDEVAVANVASLRNVWTESVAGNLTPRRLATILKEAASGQHYDFLTLAEDIEERDLHYASVLSTRKRAISGVDFLVTAGSDDKKDIEIAESVRKNITSDPQFIEMLDDLLDALAKGYSLVEIIWQRGDLWRPIRYEWCDPRYFTFDKLTGRQIRLADEDNKDGICLPPYKFIKHVPRLKSGQPVRGGLARLAAFAFMCKSFTIQHWVVFLEVFGMPLRLGKYDSNASDNDKKKLLQAVRSIASDAAAIIPESMNIDFISPSSGAGGSSKGSSAYQDAAEWWDRQLSKAILGQTATVEGTPGKLGNDTAQSDVRRDILRSDCRQLDLTINRDLIKIFVDINYGVQENYPIYKTPVLEPEDTAALISGLKELVPFGLRVKESEVRAKLGLSEPKDGDDILSVTAKPANEIDITGKKSLNRQNFDVNIGDIEDEIEAEALKDWQKILTPWRDNINQIASNAESYDEFLNALTKIDLPNEELIKSLGIATMKAGGYSLDDK